MQMPDACVTEMLGVILQGLFHFSQFNRNRPDALDKVNDDEIFQDVKRLIDDDLRVSVASSVVRVTDTRSRQDAAKELKKSDKERGRRMLGILQGTLKQFQAESAAAVKKPQMEKRRQIDAKLEAREREEKENLRRERAELFRARREHHIEVSILQQKMRILKKFEIWKEQQEKMKGFCRTSKQPFVFFRPKIQNEESKWRMEMTSRAIDALIERRRKKLETEFEETLQAATRRRLPSAVNDLSDNNNTNRVNKIDGSTAKNSRNDFLSGDTTNTNTTERWSPLNKITMESKPDNLKSFKSELSSTSNHHLSKDVFNKFSDNSYNNNNNSHREDLEAGELSDGGGSETFALGDEPQLIEEDQHQAVYTESSRHSSEQRQKRPSNQLSPGSSSLQVPAKRKLSSVDESYTHPSRTGDNAYNNNNNNDGDDDDENDKGKR
uniref:Pinin/SDK/MemA protein domain-containing protein n=1 Tax=Trichobilharzia regenti TaxID=157069 RepID=A0AA85K129_TRIRE|nr:unnamed protein product [Trichobilharzia regenti]